MSLGPVWHLWTPENFEIIFRNEDDYKSGMGIIGICAKLFPDIILLTFEIMSNHLHIAASGREERLQEMFSTIRNFLARYCRNAGYTIDWKKFVPGLRQLKTIEEVRNVIIYDNKNGYIVHPEHSPFSYPWGANKYFFNPDCKAYAYEKMKPMGLRDRRELCHSRLADNVCGIQVCNGCASPLSFCRIDLAEKLFRGAAHYFFKLGRSIESDKQISKEIGGGVFYTDDELYAAVVLISRKKYGNPVPSLLPPKDKIELARAMRYDYNASDKQIQRMLRLEATIINSI